MINLRENIKLGKYDNKVPYGPSIEDRKKWKEGEAAAVGHFFADAESYAVSMGVPEKYGQKVVAHAWARHAYGFSEVVTNLEDLFSIFE